MQPRQEYPRPQLERNDWINLNGEWSFTFDFGKSGHAQDFPESGGFKNSIIVPFAPESPLSGIRHKDFIEAEWYQRVFEVPERWAGKRILLHFGGSDYRTEVFVNGKLAGRHYGGTASFSVDLTEFVRIGGANNLVVGIRDDVRSGHQPGGKQSPEYIFDVHRCHYTRTTGIWQTVWLEAIHPLGLENLRIVPDIDRELLIITPTFLGTYVATSADANAATSSVRRALRITVADESGAEVMRIEETTSSGVSHIIPIKNPKLWNAGEPYLYNLTIEVLVNGAAVDSVSSYAGMRKVHIEGNRVFLNNQPLYQRLVLDQGFYPDGIWTAPDDDSLKRDIELSMKAGFNGARLHQKVFEERFHYWADRLGYLTWAESSSWGLTVTDPLSHRNFLSEWAEIMRRDWNHPSIITWTGLNETRQIDEDPAQHRRLHYDIYELTRMLDPTRPAHDSSGYVHVKTDLWTVHNYTQDPTDFEEAIAVTENGVYRNFPDWEPSYSGQPYLVDEFGGIKWIPPDTTPYMNTSWGYGNAPRTIDEFYERLDGMIRVLRSRTDICGWCYTQLTDVEQEQNGIYLFDRTEKFAMDRIHKILTQ